ncbi:MAG TPA: hypothetical protein VMU77_07360 [Acidimicrobiales bacterium]|nr:hypothetical protein [Acidimicrobiales bacterium]
MVSPKRPAVTEIVCHFGFQASRSFTGANLCSSMWGNRDEGPGEKTLHNYLWAAREALPPGVLSDGRSGAYTLNARINSGWRQFAVVVAQVDNTTGEQSSKFLAQALALVRGVAFTAAKGARGSSYEWASTSGLLYEIERKVEDTAHRLAILSGQTGDIEAAVFAI